MILKGLFKIWHLDILFFTPLSSELPLLLQNNLLCSFFGEEKVGKCSKHIVLGYGFHKAFQPAVAEMVLFSTLITRGWIR